MTWTWKNTFSLWWFNAFTRHWKWLRLIRTRRRLLREWLAEGKDPEVGYAIFWHRPKFTRADLEWGMAEAQRVASDPLMNNPPHNRPTGETGW